MARIAGFLAGSAVAIALILLVIGVPELGKPEPPAPEPAASAAPATVPQPPPEPVPEPVVAAPPEPPGEPAAAVADAGPEPVPAQWHAFWSPFGSRIAADGFVRRLESVTGFDYRVVKVENGVFEVAFAYSSESERDTKLTTIAAATGLELPDS